MKKQTYHILTYGCQMNKNDSQRIANFFEKNNFKETTFKQASIIILNLCSVRQTAIDRVWGKLNQIKRENPAAKIILTGCILKADRNKFFKKGFKVLNITELKNWLKEIDEPIKCLSVPTTNSGKYFKVDPKLDSLINVYVPIMTGCNNFCSYCAVPYTRGREKSRSLKDILEEVNKYIVHGAKHIILLGQNVNSYHSGHFVELLKKVDALPGEYWLSFVTSHPKDMSDELIKCFKDCQHLIPYLHLPIQAGSNKILKAMNRNYTVEDYLKLINKVKKIKSDINLSTDVIVGFPGETKNDFLESVKIFKNVGFDMAYISRYSPRSGTVAAEMLDDVSAQEKAEREKELTKILKKTALQNNKKMIGQEAQVLIEKITATSSFGKTRSFKNIKILNQNNPKLLGKFVKVKITKAHIWNLEGKIIK